EGANRLPHPFAPSRDVRVPRVRRSRLPSPAAQRRSGRPRDALAAEPEAAFDAAAAREGPDPRAVEAAQGAGMDRRKGDDPRLGPPGAMLGIYIHIPFCSSICSYCNFNRGLFDEPLKQRDVEALRGEIAVPPPDLRTRAIYF